MVLNTPAEIVIFINGKKYDTTGYGPNYPLVDFIRGAAKFKGTKSNCAYGCTGASTVLMTSWDRENEEYCHRAIPSATTPLASCHYRNITTVEGLGTTENLHKIQRLLVENHAVQCGYDTPGIVMSMFGLLLNNKQPSMKDIEKAMLGNLSRCNGYRAVYQAFKEYTESPSNEREPFEAGLPDLRHDILEPVTFKDEDCTWCLLPSFSWLKPMQLREPNGALIYGIPTVTELKDFKVVFDLSRAENSKKQMKGGIDLAANTTLTDLVAKLNGLTDKDNVLVFRELANAIENIKTLQYRNARAVGDALMDNNELKCLLGAVGASVSLQDSSQCKLKKMFGSDVTVSIKRVLGEASTANLRYSSIKCVSIPAMKRDKILLHENVADRLGNGINLNFVSAMMSVDNNVVESMDICLGGTCKGVKVLTNAGSAVKGLQLNDNSVCEKLKDLSADPLLSGLLTKLSHHMADLASLSHEDRRAYFKARRGTRKFVESTQFKERVNKEKLESPNPLGRPIPTLQGYQCATGQAVFTEDIPEFANELFFAPVLSTIAHGNIKSVNADEALKIKGVHYFISAKDAREGTNVFKINGLVDEVMFADNLVEHEGQLIGGILADNEHIGRKAAALVKVDYEVLKPVVTLEDAVEASNTITGEGQVKLFEKGEIEAALSGSQHVISGSMKTPRQEHFYEEVMCCLVVPSGEDGEIDVYIPSPAILLAQPAFAAALGLPFHKVLVHCRRVGCSYGGKYGRFLSFACGVALAAQKMGRPVRCKVTRDEDIRIMGQRGEFGSTYKVGVTDGKIQGVIVDMQKNSGWNSDASPDICSTAMAHIDSGYDFPALKCTGEVYKTNTASNTAFRAYGAPPAVAITENMISDICAELNYDQYEFRKKNLQQEGYVTHYEHVMEACDVTMDMCLDEVAKQVEYHKTKAEVEEFNKNNTVKKRGIAIIANKYGLGIPGMFGKGSCLLNIYLDGSILLSVNGIEMGQGLFTKMAQIASHELGVDISRIKLDPNSNRVLPNPIPTGGSTGTDLSGNAVLNACKQVVEKLAPFKKAQPDAPWEMLVGMAFASGTNLSTTGHYQLPAERYTFDPATKKGRRWWYYTCGASFAMVEVDLRTGQHQLLKANIAYDIGESLNTAIDAGQIEAAFIQGYGYMAMEQTLYDSEGRLLTRGHDEYAMPSMADCPPEFDVTLMRGNKETEQVLYTSKGIGEPPFFSGQTVYFAIKDALVAAKKAAGGQGTVNLATPAVPINVLDCIKSF
eukprot:TRINITY_DN10324_c0_g1_i1.p1 TRINITY_DN10324_c0_g1~~TRINITY_DN10324_c0_g1_i1.p1  ORF type:complete len:1254 (+),score=453.48 TRINITY_DN10324_c0_g1_i1:28-3789(+)